MLISCASALYLYLFLLGSHDERFNKFETKFEKLVKGEIKLQLTWWASWHSLAFDSHIGQVPAIAIDGK